VASVMWDDEDDPFPKFIAREDLRIPTDTETNFRNLDWLAVRDPLTPGELVNKVWGNNADEHWDKKAVAKILAAYKDVNYDTPMTYIDWETQPEKIAELVKQSLGYYESDAMPSIPIWRFYFKDTDKKWYKVCVPDRAAMRGTSGDPEKFLYKNDKPVAKCLSELLHCQFGDLAFKTPFRVHSIRSLGFELFEPCYWMNLTRCRLLQHIHQNFNPWLQINDPADKARAESISFDGPVARIPQGVHVMTGQERHQIDPNLVEMGMAQTKQLMQEASATYTQSTDTGTSREQTAFETGVKVQQVNAMLVGLLAVANELEKPLYVEMSRRFCKLDPINDDVKDFQESCKNAGVPRNWLDVKYWDVEIEKPLGGGNPTMEQVAANQLMAIRKELNPTAAQEVLHDALCVFADSKRAARWAPMDGKRKVSDAVAQANADFGSLMWGSPCPIREELNAPEQIETLLGKLAGIISRIEQQGNMTDQAEISGLTTVAEHVNLLIQQLATNPTEKERVNQYKGILSKLMNAVKGFQQRLQQKMQQGGNGNGKGGAEMMKVHSAMLADKIKAHREGEDERRKDAAFQADQRRKDATAYHEILVNRLKAFEEPKAASGDKE